jgi:hypothetical protein
VAEDCQHRLAINNGSKNENKCLNKWKATSDGTILANAGRYVCKQAQQFSLVTAATNSKLPIEFSCIFIELFGLNLRLGVGIKLAVWLRLDLK